MLLLCQTFIDTDDETEGSIIEGIVNDLVVEIRGGNLCFKYTRLNNAGSTDNEDQYIIANWGAKKHCTWPSIKKASKQKRSNWRGWVLEEDAEIQKQQPLLDQNPAICSKRRRPDK